MEMEEVERNFYYSKTTSEWVIIHRHFLICPTTSEDTLLKSKYYLCSKYFWLQQLSNGNVFLQWSSRDFTEINSNGTDV
jgi:hypothetical protein